MFLCIKLSKLIKNIDSQKVILIMTENFYLNDFLIEIVSFWMQTMQYQITISLTFIQFFFRLGFLI